MSKSAKSQTGRHSEETLALYSKLIAARPEIERKGASMPYTSMNGNMFSFLNKEGILALRLSPGIREDYMKKYKGSLCVEHGVIMKEYVSVPEQLFKNTSQLLSWFDLSVEYVKSLKPKPTTKK